MESNTRAFFSLDLMKMDCKVVHKEKEKRDKRKQKKKLNSKYEIIMEKL